MDDERKKKKPPADGMDMLVLGETMTAPAAYWFWTTLAAAIVLIDAAVVVMLRQGGHPSGSIAIAGLAIGALAAFVYFIGWGWRWVFTRRCDHLFGTVKYSSHRKEQARKKWVRVLSVVSWLPF